MKNIDIEKKSKSSFNNLKELIFKIRFLKTNIMDFLKFFIDK